ncbi:class I SAM-dependent methyltransferase [Nocardia sp. CC227C]|uniref:class I SAM-dependent methyltransferase n=1 Tax=Nocardia sp. CC227C TaxID=3044562 RepID=UPI00278C560A|nr:methyltransferase domain-containing protein [Nocardia sp. CC227C]
MTGDREPAALGGASPAAIGSLSGTEFKTCCADGYSRDVVALLLGESFHPGGSRLTRRLADRLGLRPARRVLDVASGPGSTARLLAAEYRVRVEGIDLAAATVARATAAAECAGLGDTVRFRCADAEAIPFEDGAFDAVVCECALCLFPDKSRAAAEFARMLRPGGRVGITDVTVSGSGLPPELTDLVSHIACIADARPAAAYADLLTGAGLRVTLTEHHDRAVATMLDHIEARLTLLRITAPAPLAERGMTRSVISRYLHIARDAVTEGHLGYALITAEKPH